MGNWYSTTNYEICHNFCSFYFNSKCNNNSELQLQPIYMYSHILFFFLLQLNICQSLSQFSEKEEDHGQLLDQALLKIREIENVQDISMEEHEENQFRIKEMSMQIIKAVIDRGFYGIPRDPNYWKDISIEQMQFDEDAIEENT